MTDFGIRGTFFPGLDGFEEVQNPDVDIFRMYVPDIAAFTESGHKPGETVICTAKIKHIGSTYLKQWNFLKSLVPSDRHHELKLTLPAPEWYHLVGGTQQYSDITLIGVCWK